MDGNVALLEAYLPDETGSRYFFNESKEFSDFVDFWEDSNSQPEYFTCEIIKIGDSVYLDKMGQKEWGKMFHEGDLYDTCLFCIEDRMPDLPDGVYSSDWLFSYYEDSDGSGHSWRVYEEIMFQIDEIRESPLDRLYGALTCGYVEPHPVDDLPF